MSYSAKWRYQTYCGQMEVHSLQVGHLKITCRNGYHPQEVHPALSTEQWEGKGNSSYEEVNQSSMDREIFRQDHTLPSSPSVSEHIFS